MVARRPLVLVLALVLPALVLVLRNGVSAMIGYEIVLDPVFVTGEAINAHARIVNQGVEAAELPDPTEPMSVQPTYTLYGSPYPQGITFCARPPALSDDLRPSPLMSVGPGRVWEGKVALSLMTDITAPGDYLLDTWIDWQEHRVASPQRKFTIEKPNIASLHVGFSTSKPGRSLGECVYIHRGAGGAKILSAEFSETRPDIGEMEVTTALSRARVGEMATDAASPVTNYPFHGQIYQWILWREEHTLYALINVSQAPYKLDLPEEPAYMVGPPLQAHGLSIEALTVSKDLSNLSLSRFVRQVDPAAQAGKVAWTSRLPAKADLVTAALPPESLKSDLRHIAFVAQQADGIEIFHATYPENGSLGPFQTVEIRGGRLLANANLALFVDGKGVASVTALVVTDADRHLCAAVEARFAPSGQPMGEGHLVSAGSLSAEPVGGGTLYTPEADGTTQRHVVLVAQGNQVYRLDSPDRASRCKIQGAPTLPVILVPGKYHPYIVYTSAESAPYFEPVL